MSKPTSIGDEIKKPSKYSLIKETYPLPPSRNEVISKFAEILNLGMVQKVLVQIGLDINVERYSETAGSPSEELIPELPEPEEDLLAYARNGEIGIIHTLEETPLEHLQLAFLSCARASVKPIAIYVNTYAALSYGLGITLENLAVFNKKELFGVEIKETPALPEDTLLLIGRSDSKTFSVKINMTTPSDKPKAKKGKK